MKRRKKDGRMDRWTGGGKEKIRRMVEWIYRRKIGRMMEGWLDG